MANITYEHIASLAGLHDPDDELAGAEEFIPPSPSCSTPPANEDPQRAREFVLQQERARLALRAKRRQEAIQQALRAHQARDEPAASGASTVWAPGRVVGPIQPVPGAPSNRQAKQQRPRPEEYALPADTVITGSRARES